MEEVLDRAERGLARLRALGVGELGSLSTDALHEFQDIAVSVKQAADALVGLGAGEVVRRSRPEDGAGGFARKAGFASPERLIAKKAGISVAEASRLADVGQVLVPSGEGGLPVRFPHVALAVRAGSISSEIAAVTKRGLDRLEVRVDAEVVDRLERRLVDKAASLSLAHVKQMVERAVATVDPAGLEERERRLYEERSVTVRDDAGTVVIMARLDPESAAPVVTVLDAIVGDAVRRRRDQDPLTRDRRTTQQMRADGLVMMARHLLGCDCKDMSMPRTTVVVRMGLADLQAGFGVGEVQGVNEPLSVGALRRLAADAEVIPHVLGGDSETLDFGRRRRLFSAEQRLALIERDGGCAWCHAPPSWVEAHHIAWWERDAGPTDLSNGIALCVGCHRRIHRDNWDIEILDGLVWFIPPSTVDPNRRPVLGGRAAVEVRRWELAHEDLQAA
jgi:hypothetical protein